MFNLAGQFRFYPLSCPCPCYVGSPTGDIAYCVVLTMVETLSVQAITNLLLPFQHIYYDHKVKKYLATLLIGGKEIEICYLDTFENCRKEFPSILDDSVTANLKFYNNLLTLVNDASLGRTPQVF